MLYLFMTTLALIFFAAWYYIYNIIPVPTVPYMPSANNDYDDQFVELSTRICCVRNPAQVIVAVKAILLFESTHKQAGNKPNSMVEYDTRHLLSLIQSQTERHEI